MKVFTLLIFLVSLQLNAAVTYHCQTNYPPTIETTISFSSEERGSIAIDSTYLYPGTGMSWQVMLERFNRPGEASYDYANFQAFETYFYNIFVPKAILKGAQPISFPSEIYWQIEEDSRVYKNDLKCELVLKKN